MKFGPKFLWNQVLVFTLLAIGLDVVVGIGMILANKKYVAELDELQQKVYLNALGITVGVALIAGVPYSVMVSRQTINAIETGKFDPSLSLAFRSARLFGLRIEEIFHDEDRRSRVAEIE